MFYAVGPLKPAGVGAVERSNPRGHRLAKGARLGNVLSRLTMRAMGIVLIRSQPVPTRPRGLPQTI